MESTIFIRSQKGNLYIYDFLKKEIFLCHPLIYELYKNERKDFHRISNVNIKYSKEEISYYKKKYEELKKRHFFSSFQKRYFLPCTEKSIKENLSNLNNIVFEVTESCNLNCTYCVYGRLYNSYDGRENKKMNFGTFKSVIDFLIPYWTSSQSKSTELDIMIGFYGGEPLMNFSFIKECVEYLKHINVPGKHFKFNMTTNATLLHLYMDFLVENNFEITISMDGSEENHAYRVFKGNNKNSFDVVISNIRLLRNRYPLFFNSNVSFNSVLHNKNSVEDIHSFIYSEFRKKPMIHPLNATGIRQEMKTEFEEMYIPYGDNEYTNSSLMSERLDGDPRVFNLTQFLLWYGNNEFYDYESLLYMKRSGPRALTGTCSPFQRKMYVTANGSVLSCERIGDNYKLGDVSENCFTINIEKIVENYNLYNKIMWSQCKDCYMVHGCHQCIFQIKGLGEKTPICKMRCNKEQIVKYAKRFIDILEGRKISYKTLYFDTSLD